MNETRDGRQISPQWLFKPITTTTIHADSGVTVTIMPTTSDVIVSYITLKATIGQNVNPHIVVDGITLSEGGGWLPVVGTVYYLFINTVSDALAHSATVTPFGQVQAIYARSFAYTVTEAGGGAGNTYTGTVRWQSL